MSEGNNGNGKVWAFILALELALLIFVPSLMRLSGVDLDQYVEPGTIWYVLVHDSRWIIGGIIGYLIAELHLSSKGLLKSGLEEWREWRRNTPR